MCEGRGLTLCFLTSREFGSASVQDSDPLCPCSAQTQGGRGRCSYGQVDLVPIGNRLLRRACLCRRSTVCARREAHAVLSSFEAPQSTVCARREAHAVLSCFKGPPKCHCESVALQDSNPLCPAAQRCKRAESSGQGVHCRVAAETSTVHSSPATLWSIFCRHSTPRYFIKMEPHQSTRKHTRL